MTSDDKFQEMTAATDLADLRRLINHKRKAANRREIASGFMLALSIASLTAGMAAWLFTSEAGWALLGVFGFLVLVITAAVVARPQS